MRQRLTRLVCRPLAVRDVRAARQIV
jgi:hypothetical protein